jgi:hypothetical protein
MWTPASRARIVNIEPKTKRYPTDLRDEEWSAVAPLLPKPGARGRKHVIDLREVQ